MYKYLYEIWVHFMKYNIILDWRLWAIFVQFCWWVDGTVEGEVENTQKNEGKSRVLWSLAFSYLLCIGMNAPENLYTCTYICPCSSCEISALESSRMSRYRCVDIKYRGKRYFSLVLCIYLPCMYMNIAKNANKDTTYYDCYAYQFSALVPLQWRSYVCTSTRKTLFFCVFSTSPPTVPSTQPTKLHKNGLQPPT